MGRIDPHRIWQLIGHDREQYIGRQYINRRGRLSPVFYARCKRYGTTDGAEVYAEGLFERFTWWRVRVGWHRRREAVRDWFGTTCHDCGKPDRRLGRPMGDHCGCIPF